ncbi:ATP-binding protein [Chitinivorax sp. B]|uniref:ATP-binding protein n=1 Tax=Chitinivorax sp. B TaxID=2502235 RepID=UPI0010F7B8BC|nr:ATP-binding protein [Chitinivorax sp. B]
MIELQQLMARAEQLVSRLEGLLPPTPPAVDWQAPAFLWRSRHGRGYLYAVLHPHQINLDDLHNIEPQKVRIVQNTQQFVAGRPANNVLLTGARGTGKSSLVKAVLNAFASQGLRLIEVDKVDLIHLPDIVEQVIGRPERFIIFCDDLSFDEGEAGYKALKSALDGSVAQAADNVLIYATSNRRHLLPEYFHENAQTKYVGEEIHPAEAVEEKVSLSERFGLWVSFYPFDQTQYLQAVQHWLRHFDVTEVDQEEITRAALQWALSRGMRSGRVAWQFARDWAGLHG